MNDAKYIGMDVHQATISVAVRDSRGNLVIEAILETKTETILQFIRGLGGSLHVTFEEGTSAAWLYDLLKPRVTRVLVCDPRKTPLLKVGNHNDREDARKLSELLYLNRLSPVFHGETGIRTLRELARVGGQLNRSKKAVAIRGLNKNHNHDLKNIFKGAATRAAATAGPFQDFYDARIASGMKPAMARLTLARKIAAITLLVWKKGVCFDAKQLKQQAA